MFNKQSTNPPLPFVTHLELGTILQPTIDMATQALQQSGQKAHRIDLLANIIGDLQDAVTDHSSRFVVLEDRVSALEDRTTALEATVADQQQQIDALGFLIS